MKAGTGTVRWYVQILCFAFAVVLAGRVAYAQEGVSPQVLEPIPEPLRAQLVERLGLYVEYQRTKQYDKLYDLLSRSAIHTIFKDQTKEEFLRAYRAGDAQRTSTRLIQFTPTAIQLVQGDASDVYVIYGTATISQMGDLTKKPRVAVTTQLQDGKWYFSPVMDVLVD